MRLPLLPVGSRSFSPDPSAILADAVADRLMARNPAKGVKLPRQAKKLVEPPTVGDIGRLIDAMPDRYRALVVLAAAGTGLRQGECFGLTVDRVDFLGGSITVDRPLVLAGSGPPQFVPPKTEASVRGVPLPDVVATALAAHLERWPPAQEDLAFTSPEGRPLRRNRFNEKWRAATRRGGVEGIRFHDLRHFYASLLIDHGESVSRWPRIRRVLQSDREPRDRHDHLAQRRRPGARGSPRPSCPPLP